MQRQIRLITTVAFALVPLVGCTAGREASHASHQMPAAALEHVQLGRTTPVDVEQTFGTPDERGADGAMVYHARVTTKRGAVWPETVTFRFERGVLTKLCQNRARQG